MRLPNQIKALVISQHKDKRKYSNKYYFNSFFMKTLIALLLLFVCLCAD